jgi:hypothetical protein
MKSYRERYFEDYIAVPDEKRPGKVKYEYAGSYVEPFVEKGSLKTYKARMASAELLSLLLWGTAAIQDVSFNRIRAVGGIGILAVIPWALELWNVFRFVRAGAYIKELDYEEMTRTITAGALLHALLMVLTAAVGGVGVIGAADAAGSILAAAGHLASGLISFFVWRLYKKIYYHTYTGKELRKVEKSGQDEAI